MTLLALGKINTLQSLHFPQCFLSRARHFSLIVYCAENQFTDPLSKQPHVCLWISMTIMIINKEWSEDHQSKFHLSYLGHLHYPVMSFCRKSRMRPNLAFSSIWLTWLVGSGCFVYEQGNPICPFVYPVLSLSAIVHI